MCGALEEEVLEIRRSGAGRRVPLTGGKLLGQAGQQFLYVFATENAVNVPDDSPAQIELAGNRQRAAGTYACQVLSCIGFELTVGCNSPLPQDLTYATLLLDASFLLEKLSEQLLMLHPDECQIALKLFGREPAFSDAATEVQWPDEANEFQGQAIEAAASREITYIWGPPGTGKTTTLAYVAQALVERGLRVLVTASTNVAVDNAVLRIADLIDQEGAVLRFGTPQVAALRDNPMLQLEGIALAMSGDLDAERQRLEEERRGLLEPAEEPTETEPQSDQLSLFWQLPGIQSAPTRRRRPSLASVRHVSDDQMKRLQEAERSLDRKLELLRERALREARVVGATLSRTFLAANLAGQSFDAVLLDEVSAAPLPAVFYAASLARGKAVALGDPKQLPPIALANSPTAQRWLHRDLFEAIGLSDDDDRAVLLREQYRMHPHISRLANELVYGGKLIDAPRRRVRSDDSEDDAQRDSWASRQAVYQAVQLIDTSEARAECERPASGSRLNVAHAERALELAIECIETGGRQDTETRLVAIITPYAAQAKLIWRLLRDEGISHLVDVGTVHRFQGLERETIIFDTVEGPPIRPAPFLSGSYGSEAMRLINVAITRARSRLLVIANVDYLARSLHRRSTLMGLLELLRE